VPWLSDGAVTSVHITVATMSEQLKNKILNPEAHFDKPKHVAEDNALSHQEKRRLSITGSRMNDRC
jgi:hypothetical protein